MAESPSTVDKGGSKELPNVRLADYPPRVRCDRAERQLALVELGSSNPHAAGPRSHLNSRPTRTPIRDNLAGPRAIYSENFIRRLFVYRARLCKKS